MRECLRSESEVVVIAAVVDVTVVSAVAAVVPWVVAAVAVCVVATLLSVQWCGGVVLFETPAVAIPLVAWWNDGARMALAGVIVWLVRTSVGLVLAAWVVAVVNQVAMVVVAHASAVLAEVLLVVWEMVVVVKFDVVRVWPFVVGLCVALSVVMRLMEAGLCIEKWRLIARLTSA
jgi:hypothetical protein